MSQSDLKWCYWHPYKPATHWVNLGVGPNKDLPACSNCAADVMYGIRIGLAGQNGAKVEPMGEGDGKKRAKPG